MKPRMYPVLEMCIENGTRRGINRAYKHTDEPSREAVEENIIREIMNEIHEWFAFEEDKDEF